MPDESAQSVVPTSKNFNFHKVFAAIGVILVVAIIVIGGVWAYVESQGGNKTDDIEEDTIKVSTPSAKLATKSSEKDETVDWETDNNVKYFVKYPEGWSASISTNTSPSSIIVESNNKEIRIMFARDLATGPNLGPSTNIIEIGKTTVEVNGVDLDFSEAKRKDNGYWYFTHVEFSFYIQASSATEPSSELKSTIKSIISTFKFI